MPEYADDNIRRYAWILQRMVMVAAVIIAVPVMMWTISTFIRSYVGRPMMPAFQHLTRTETTQSLPPASPVAASVPASDAAQPAPGPLHADAVTTTNDGRALLPDANAQKGPSLGPSAEDAIPASGPPLRGTVGSFPPIVTEAGSTSPPLTAPPIALPESAVPPAPAPTEGVTSRIATHGTGTMAVAPTDRGFAWPDPNTDSPSFGALPQPPRIAEVAAPETPPAPEPIEGRIPLPRHRPGVKAMSATANTAATGSIAPAGRVPLPRVRPDAPVDRSPATNAP
jgi:hypothetical protein